MTRDVSPVTADESKVHVCVGVGGVCSLGLVMLIVEQKERGALF